MKKQIIAWIVLATLATTGAYTYANNSSTGSVNKTEIMDLVKKVREGVSLTTDEQAKLDAIKLKKWQKYEKFASGQTMSGSGFEMRWKMWMGWMMGWKMNEGRETVIDKLLAWTALTADEEILRAEIIKERAEMKAKKAEMDAKMTEIKAIMEKKKAGTTLTTEEQAKLDTMKKEMPKSEKWRMWEVRWMMR